MKTAKKLVIVLLLVAITTAMLSSHASAGGGLALGVAFVDTNGVRILSGPGLDFPILSQANKGDIVIILEHSSIEWLKVNYYGTVGYMSAPILRNKREVASFNARGVVSGNVVNIRAKPGVSGSILVSCRSNTEMYIIGINNGWFKVKHGSFTGYIRSDLMNILPPRTPSTTGVRVVPRLFAPDPNLPLGQQIAEHSVSFLGIRYKWGGNSPSTGFDCSGFVVYIMRQYNINLTRTSAGQYNENGAHIDKSDLVPGDLVFFSSNTRTVTHVGIYIGDGKFIHASSTRVGIIISDLNSTNYARAWWGAKRVVE